MLKFEIFIKLVFATVSMYSVASFSSDEIANEGFASVKQFPFLVSIQELGKTHLCGGILISLGHVLTAAHCVSVKKVNSTVVFTKEANDLSVLSGAIYASVYAPNRQNRTVRGIYLHPGYGYRNILDDIWLHDMAILELKTIFKKDPYTTTAPFSERKIAIDNMDKYKQSRMKCFHTGWRIHGSDNSTRLKFVQMVLMGDTECSSYMCSLSKEFCSSLEVELMCARLYRARISSFTDSGGPLICKGKIFGLNIYNNGHLDTQLRSLYVTISDINNFIYLVKDFSSRTTASYTIIFALSILVMSSKLY